MFKLLRAKSIRPCYEFILLSTKQLPWCHIRINLLQVQREFCECFPRRIICLQTIIACTVIFAYYGFFLNIFSFTPLVTNKWPFRLQHGLQNTTLNTTFATEYLCIKANLFTFMMLYFVTPDNLLVLFLNIQTQHIKRNMQSKF